MASCLINLVSGLVLDEFDYSSQENVSSQKGKLTRMDVRIRSRKYAINIKMQRRIDGTCENTLTRARTSYAMLASIYIEKGNDYLKARRCNLFIFVNESFNK